MKNKCVNYSFIIPHHDNPEDLKRCIRSIPVRDDIEVIVVDDNSSEDKIPILNREGLILHRINKLDSCGAGKARNVGISLAHGKWILFADCDDFYEKGFINELDKYVDSDYDFIVFDAFWHIDLQANCVRNDNKLSVYIEEYHKCPSDDKNRILVKHSSNACWNKMISREYVNRIGDKFDEVPKCNDGWFVQFLVGESDNFALINKKLYYYVYTANSITTKLHPISTIVTTIKTTGRIHDYMSLRGANCCIPPFYKGLGSYYKQYGLWGVIYLFAIKTFMDSPIRRILKHRF